METILAKTVGEMAAQSMAAVRAFERLGIDYCCGGKRPLDEVCRERGIAPSVVAAEIQQLAPVAESVDWQTAPLAQLIKHIVTTHHDFLKQELPRLSERLAKVQSAHGDRNPNLAGVFQTFQGLRAELETHLGKEEMILFPAIGYAENPAAGNPPPMQLTAAMFGGPVAVMEAEHESAGAALARLRELTDGFEIPEYACNTYRAALTGLQELEADLHLHIHLENNILFPRAMKLASKR